ncbi:PP2C family protein-serine/threonine phosphatase [Tundrisphaera sp. TA3]|uniref:PP2C family protein-serine/threonine phosphatase n=1 Tax=Tundrisphaera sp. TA3 TaxID=3435775 RepID=UPI003EBE2047
MTNRLGSVLVVDDDANNRDILSRRLRRLGYDVEVGADGQRALDLVAARPFDVVLLDVMMPGLDGFEVLAKIREAHPPTALPVIMATAKDESEDVIRALGSGANDYVTKPLDFPVVAARVRSQVELKRAVDQVRELERQLSDRNRELERANERMSRDLRAAARVQEALLPHPSPDLPGLDVAWAFRPCDELAGDGLNAIALDGHRVALYVLDVSGHGVAASMMSVSLARLLSSPADASSILIRGGDGPERHEILSASEVAGRLNRLFPFESTAEQYSTLAFGILDTKAGTLRYTLAGHPGPIHLPADSSPRILAGRGFPVGLAEIPYQEHAVDLKVGDRLFLYSDGIPDAPDLRNQPYGQERLMAAIEAHRGEPLGDAVAAIMADVERWCQGESMRDDVSLLAVEVRQREEGLGT